MAPTVTLVQHPLVAVTARGLRARTPSTTGSLALARPNGDPHGDTAR